MKKLELNRKQIIISSIAASAVVICVLVIYVYRPLRVKLGAMDREFQRIKQELEIARDAVNTGLKPEVEQRLLTQQDVSLAIDAITRTGRMLGVNFVSISPRETENLGTSGYKRMPVDMDLESGYKALALFLGALRDLDEAVVTVRRFRVQGDKKILPRVKSRLLVEIYLKAEENGSE
jgi:Tfp pilus assembly protein PilO